MLRLLNLEATRMELILSSLALTFLLLTGAIADFLTTRSSPSRARYGAAFLAEPRSTAIVEHTSNFVPEPEYDQAA